MDITVKTNKHCRGCNATKPIESFYFLNKKKGWRRSKCCDCVNKQNATWREQHREQHRELCRNRLHFRYRDELDTQRAKSADDTRRHNLELKIQCFEKLGGKCCRCDYDTDKRALQIDHVHGGGTKERRKLGSTAALYRKVLKDNDGNYQLLCANCNQIKKHENEEWGKQGVRKL